MNIIICMLKKFVFNDGFVKINNEKLINVGIMLMCDWNVLLLIFIFNIWIVLLVEFLMYVYCYMYK